MRQQINKAKFRNSFIKQRTLKICSALIYTISLLQFHVIYFYDFR